IHPAPVQLAPAFRQDEIARLEAGGLDVIGDEDVGAGNGSGIDLAAIGNVRAAHVQVLTGLQPLSRKNGTRRRGDGGQDLGSVDGFAQAADRADADRARECAFQGRNQRRATRWVPAGNADLAPGAGGGPPEAHSRKAASSAARVSSIVSSRLTSASRRKSGMINLAIDLIDAGLRRRIARARVGHLATSDGLTPSVVPVCFVLLGETLYQALDGKPKSAAPAQLRRVKNVRANPRAALLIDHYVEDWRRLWYVLLRGRPRVLKRWAEQRRPMTALTRKYRR